MCRDKHYIVFASTQSVQCPQASSVQSGLLNTTELLLPPSRSRVLELLLPAAHSCPRRHPFPVSGKQRLRRRVKLCPAKWFSCLDKQQQKSFWVRDGPEESLLVEFLFFPNSHRKEHRTQKSERKVGPVSSEGSWCVSFLLLSQNA